MQEYSVGPDVCDYIPNDENFVWVVYWYKIGDYCGDGEYLALHKDGTLYNGGMSHCSCYGPFDGGLISGSSFTKEEILGTNGYILISNINEDVLRKAQELLR